MHTNPFAAQLIQELYATTPNHHFSLYQVPADSQPFWNSTHMPFNPENYHTYHMTPCEKKEEEPTLAFPKATAPKLKLVQDEQEVVFNSNDESHERSPRLRTNQAFGRNVTANVFGNMLKEVQIHPRYRAIIQKAVCRHKTAMSSGQFLDLLRKKCSRLKSYVGTEKMTRMLRAIVFKKQQHKTMVSKEREFSLILRIVGRCYLHLNHIPFAWTTLKIKNRSRAVHMMGIRRVLEVMQPSLPPHKKQ